MSAPLRSSIGRRAIIPEWLLRTDASDLAIRLYATLDAVYADREGIAFPSRRTLAADLGHLSTDSVDRAVAELKRVGALSVTYRSTAVGRQTSNTYRLRHTRPSGGRKDAALPQGSGGAAGSRRGRAA